MHALTSCFWCDCQPDALYLNDSWNPWAVRISLMQMTTESALHIFVQWLTSTEPCSVRSINIILVCCWFWMCLFLVHFIFNVLCVYIYRMEQFLFLLTVYSPARQFLFCFALRSIKWIKATSILSGMKIAKNLKHNLCIWYAWQRARLTPWSVQLTKTSWVARLVA